MTITESQLTAWQALADAATPGPVVIGRYLQLIDEVAELRAALAVATATNTRLNRRCQEYERGLREKIATATTGLGLGRMLANAAARMYSERLQRIRELARPCACYLVTRSTICADCQALRDAIAETP